MPIKIDYKKCCWKDGNCSSCKCGKACTGCVEVCPVNALSRKQKLEWDKSQCIDCGLCVEACKHDALKLVST